MSNEHLTIANDLRERYSFATMRDTGQLYIYRDGVYIPNGEAFIQEQAKNQLGKDFSTHKVNEIINWVRYSSFVHRDSFDRDHNVINVLNGLLDIETTEFHEHTPKYLSLVQIPVFHYQKSQCPRINQFFTEVLKPEDIPLIEEMFGYCLLPEYRFHKAFLLQGPGRNGKTTLLNLLQRLLGKRNTANVSLGELSSDRFAAAQLFGKLANVFADLPAEALRETGKFKALTGGDKITAQRKFQSPFEFTNYAKLMFSCNYVPITHDLSPAFFSRWIIIRFPNTFEGERANPRLLDELCSEEELSGLLNLAVKGLHRLLENKAFSCTETTEEVAQKYQRLSNPVAAFLADCCQEDLEAYIIKVDLYNAFKAYCQGNSYPILSEKKFTEWLTKLMPVSTFRPTLPNGERPMVWRGIAPLEDVKDVKDVNLPLNLMSDNNKSNKIEKKVDKVDMVDAVKVSSITTGKETLEGLLGMTIAEAVAIWHKEGAPVIHLSPGKNCSDLERMLSLKDIKPEHVSAIRQWLEKHRD